MAVRHHQTHFHGLFRHFPGVGIHFPGLPIHFPGVGIHGVKWNGLSGALRSLAAPTDAGAVPGDPRSACAAPAPATLNPARATPTVTTFQVAGRSIDLPLSSLQFLSPACPQVLLAM
jgi:hypothetical protein